jgi:hypothetical protein
LFALFPQNPDLDYIDFLQQVGRDSKAPRTLSKVFVDVIKVVTAVHQRIRDKTKSDIAVPPEESSQGARDEKSFESQPQGGNPVLAHQISQAAAPSNDQRQHANLALNMPVVSLPPKGKRKADAGEINGLAKLTKAQRRGFVAAIHLCKLP